MDPNSEQCEKIAAAARKARDWIDCYGQHVPGCCFDSDRSEIPCDCGLLKTLRSLCDALGLEYMR